MRIAVCGLASVLATVWCNAEFVNTILADHETFTITHQLQEDEPDAANRVTLSVWTKQFEHVLTVRLREDRDGEFKVESVRVSPYNSVTGDVYIESDLARLGMAMPKKYSGFVSINAADGPPLLQFYIESSRGDPVTIPINVEEWRKNRDADREEAQRSVERFREQHGEAAGDRQ